MSTTPETEPAQEKKWWLAIGGVAQGPYTAAYINVSLRTKTLVPEISACLVGTQEWRPITSWAEFGMSPVPPPVPPSLKSSASQNPFIDPDLPSMANWLCIYCLGWRPLMSVFALLTWTSSPVIVLISPPTSLLATAAFVTGGIYLRKHRKRGLTIIKVTIWAVLALTGLFILSFAALFFLAILAGSAASEPGAQSHSGAGEAGALMPLFWLLEVGFQIPALQWLQRNNHSLPCLRD
jgi:hypothetical protein